MASKGGIIGELTQIGVERSKTAKKIVKKRNVKRKAGVKRIRKKINKAIKPRR